MPSLLNTDESEREPGNPPAKSRMPRVSVMASSIIEQMEFFSSQSFLLSRIGSATTFGIRLQHHASKHGLATKNDRLRVLGG